MSSNVCLRFARLIPADWSTCQLSERAVCGAGLKTRMLDCVRSDGKSVDLKLCKEVGGGSVMKSVDLELCKVVGGGGGFMDGADAEGQGNPGGNTGILFSVSFN